MLVLGWWSCEPLATKNVETANKFFNIVGLIDHQVKMLDSVSLSLLKIATIDGVEENILLTSPNFSTWTKELAIFKSADINKPILVDSYELAQIETVGIKTTIYKSRFPKATQVDSLAISFIDNEEIPIKIHARLTSNNSLFESEKSFDLVFKNVNAQRLISNYKIEGWQKMISKDPISYLIEGSVK